MFKRLIKNGTSFQYLTESGKDHEVHGKRHSLIISRVCFLKLGYISCSRAPSMPDNTESLASLVFLCDTLIINKLDSAAHIKLQSIHLVGVSSWCGLLQHSTLSGPKIRKFFFFPSLCCLSVSSSQHAKIGLCCMLCFTIGSECSPPKLIASLTGLKETTDTNYFPENLVSVMLLSFLA